MVLGVVVSVGGNSGDSVVVVGSVVGLVSVGDVVARKEDREREGKGDREEEKKGGEEEKG